MQTGNFLVHHILRDLSVERNQVLRRSRQLMLVLLTWSPFYSAHFDFPVSDPQQFRGCDIENVYAVVNSAWPDVV